MKINSVKNVAFLGAILAIFSANNAMAWTHEVAVSYGGGREFLENYHNQAVLIFGKIYKFKKIDNMLYASIDGTLGFLSADDAPIHRNTTIGALSLAFRAYFQNPDFHKIRPYVGASFGPAYLTDQQLGFRRQGSNFAFQTAFEGGIEFGLSKGQSLDVAAHLFHYCNAGIFVPNQGINIPFALSLGYQF